MTWIPLKTSQLVVWIQLVCTWTISVLKLFLSVLVNTKEIGIEPSQTKMLVIAIWLSEEMPRISKGTADLACSPKPLNSYLKGS